jgi:hypothetical protein
MGREAWQTGRPMLHGDAVEPLPVYLIHWNAPDWVASAAASVLASDLPVQVTVIDNGPFEASVQLDLPGGVRVVPTGRNLGYAGGANVAIGESRAMGGRYCVVAAHDLLVETDSLRRLIEAAETHPGCGVLGPVVEPGGFGELLGQDGDVEYRTWVSGTCLLLRLRCIEEVGGFDEDFRSYTEDEEFGLRANDHGWRVGRVLTAKARGRGSVVEDDGELFRPNQVLMAYKRRGLLAALLRLGREVASLGYHVVSGLVPGPVGAEHRSVICRGIRIVRRSVTLIRRHRRSLKA